MSCGSAPLRLMTLQREHPPPWPLRPQSRGAVCRPRPRVLTLLCCFLSLHAPTSTGSNLSPSSHGHDYYFSQHQPRDEHPRAADLHLHVHQEALHHTHHCQIPSAPSRPYSVGGQHSRTTKAGTSPTYHGRGANRHSPHNRASSPSTPTLWPESHANSVPICAVYPC